MEDYFSVQEWLIVLENLPITNAILKAFPENAKKAAEILQSDLYKDLK